MNSEFKNIMDELPALMERLKKSTPFMKYDLKPTLSQGIYVFYEGDRPMYVGRSGREGRFKQRIMEHSRPRSGHNTATFAFLIAKKDAENTGIDLNKSRDDLQGDSDFEPLYTKAKERVSKMQARVIEIPDSITQTLFEVYAALELKTPYNEWGTH